ncbi:TetR family transcriptional regulator [Alkalisalibacterium limincola]|nr:TetR family transcriptional regulator [Alkalisalibacterium limincola]
MARKTKEEAEQTRESILDAAELAFRDCGVSRTSLDQIAKRAGCTRGAVYWHFENKFDLFGALMERTQSPLFQRFERAVSDDQPDPVDAMREATIHSIQDLATNPHSRNMLEILFHRCEFVDELAPVVDRHTEKMQWVIGNSARAFKRAQSLGLVDTDLCPEFCAAMFHTLTTGIIRDWLLAPETIPIRSISESMIDHLLASFGHVPSKARAVTMRERMCEQAQATTKAAQAG